MTAVIRVAEEDLIRVQVDREDTVDPDDGQHVGHYLGADGHAGGTRTAILAGIAEVGDDSGDTSGRGSKRWSSISSTSTGEP